MISIKLDKTVAHLLRSTFSSSRNTNIHKEIFPESKIIKKEKKFTASRKKKHQELKFRSTFKEIEIKVNLSHHQFQPSSILKQIFPPGC